MSLLRINPVLTALADYLVVSHHVEQLWHRCRICHAAWQMVKNRVGSKNIGGTYASSFTFLVECALITLRFLPATSLPSRALMASMASFLSGISMKQ